MAIGYAAHLLEAKREKISCNGFLLSVYLLSGLGKVRSEFKGRLSLIQRSANRPI